MVAQCFIPNPNNKAIICRVILRKNNKAIICRVHRLVAQCFIPNPNNLLKLIIKMKIRKNNSVKNLECCTALYNVQYSAPRRRHKIQRGSKLKRLILQFDRSGKFVSKFNSIYDAERKTGLFYLNKKFRSHVDNNNPKILYGYMERNTDNKMTVCEAFMEFVNSKENGSIITRQEIIQYINRETGMCPYGWTTSNVEGYWNNINFVISIISYTLLTICAIYLKR